MSTFGNLFRVTTFGESHCQSVGCIVDGCPPGLDLSAADIQMQLSRRRPGQSDLTTPRNEQDRVEVQSGVERGVTLGTPICLSVRNKDHRPNDYSDNVLDAFPRPSHADYTYLRKYGVKASSGGGRSSARETIGRVAAGAIADRYLRLAHGVECVAFVSSVGEVKVARNAMEADIQAKLPSFFAKHEDTPSSSSCEDEEEEVGHNHTACPIPPTNHAIAKDYFHLLSNVTRDQVDKSIVRCPDEATAARMISVIEECRDEHDSVGGTVTCVIRGLKAGLGEPCFDKLEAKLAHAMLSIPATKGFELGSGFQGAAMRGSSHNDCFVASAHNSEPLSTQTNWSGGIQGGISNGQDVFFSVPFKPAATISRPQSTARYDGTEGVLETRGRHDPCVLPRAVPIVESMASIVVMDALLQQNARQAALDSLERSSIARPAWTSLPNSMRLNT